MGDQVLLKDLDEFKDDFYPKMDSRMKTEKAKPMTIPPGVTNMPVSEYIVIQ